MYSANYRPPGRGTQFKGSGPAPETISLRDEIAMRVCAALLIGRGLDGGFPNLERLCDTSYEVADAMLARREGGE